MSKTKEENGTESGKAPVIPAIDPKEIFSDAFLYGAATYASASGHPSAREGNEFLHTIAASTRICEKAYQVWYDSKFKRDKDWRIGNWASPISDTHWYYHPWKYALVRFKVVKVHPSGFEGLECPDGILEIEAHWRGGSPVAIWVPADEWCVA